ncbi:hypothetical protein GP486_000132 [Trichoglossum hirsutum]|uniref:HAM1-like N-terminal domain-containing protein n=1 Tax=Trichoglossum hirsutum TaxID=265104 RepID=A0A9P8RU65_9PEZI|nr:hypothetical protein GP486_000132 [Trichoglossum hirsutum]
MRALSKGFMPSTEQIVINLRTLLASDVLSPNNQSLSGSGRLLSKLLKQLLKDFIELLRHKNDDDQIQEFIWLLLKSKISLDVDDLANTSLKTVGSLLLTNSDFRLFLSDLSVIGRQVFAETAFAASNIAHEAGEQSLPSEQDIQAVVSDSEPRFVPSVDDLDRKASEVPRVVASGVARTGQEAVASLEDKLSGEQKDALVRRLKRAIVKLRGRSDYSDSVSIISKLIQRYAKLYSRAVDETTDVVKKDLEPNAELDRAVERFWHILSSFGDRGQWEELENQFKKLMTHSQKDTEFEDLINDVGNALQKLLMDPNFFHSARNEIESLRKKYQGIGSGPSLRKNVDNFLLQLQRAFQSIIDDEDVSKLLSTNSEIFHVLSPTNRTANPELIGDFLQVFLPLSIQGIQYIPIPRLEISTRGVDLLLENLVLEPGRAVNNSSFFPYRLRIEACNDLEIRKARFKTTSKVTSLVSIKADGVSIRADDVGFWMRAHKGLIRLADEGIASFQLDERGIDVQIDVEIGKDQLEKILTLRDVRVKIHKLSYTLRKSKFGCLAWCLKPFIRPILRKVFERRLATAIANSLHAANRELLFARERLRATRISDPKDLGTFIKAVASRLTPEGDADSQTHFGVTPSDSGVFAGIYAPGSVVKLWNEEAERAREVVGVNAPVGWRNEIFDIQTWVMS